MKKGEDIHKKFDDVQIIHQKIPGKELETHSHKEHEFFLPLQGEVKVKYELGTLSCGPGKLLYLPPTLKHSFTSGQSGMGERIILLVEKFQNKGEKLEFGPMVLPLNSLVKELIFYLLINKGSKFEKTFIKALKSVLLENISLHDEISSDDLYLLQSKAVDERLKNAFTLIIDNEKELKVSELAKEVGMSPRNLGRLFLKEIGTTPNHIIVLKKINTAKELLISTERTVTDIGLDVGYNSLSKFISAFQKYTGKLPSSFREASKLS
ncbi:MAG: AraC family transcriptional regulator [Halobacteriovoraceae bacterium]|nr:AraC family transcriptional regulator [Halobacteriovoraceae bacterium]